MKFDDALRQIKGAQSVGGQLIINRGGRNILVGRDLQGTLIVEDNEEAKGIAREVDDKAFDDGREAAEFSEDRSPLSTHPAKATLHPTDPAPYQPDVQQPASGDAATVKEAYEPPDGSDDKTAKPNTEGQSHHVHVDDKVDTKDRVKDKDDDDRPGHRDRAKK